MATEQQIKDAVDFVVTLAELVRASGRIPAGHLYALVMDRCDLTNFESFLSRLVGARLVRRDGDVLVWIGPNLRKG
jgi:hypothetical protein